MAKKVCLIVTYGQSNEQGVSCTPFDRLGGVKGIAAANLDSNIRFQPAFGPNQVGVTSTTPSVFMASLFQLLAEAVARETGWDVRLINNAIGGQAVIEGWTGWDGTLLRPKLPGESGYDPSNPQRIAKNTTQIQQAIADGYEVWALTAGHQADFSNGHTVAHIVAANTTVQQQAALAGASKVFVGVTWRQMYTNAAKWDAGGDYLLVRDGIIANLKALAQSGNLGTLKPADVMLGGDLSPNTDIRLGANDNLNYIHMNHAGTCWSAEVWLNAFKTAKVI